MSEVVFGYTSKKSSVEPLHFRRAQNSHSVYMKYRKLALLYFIATVVFYTTAIPEQVNTLVQHLISVVGTLNYYF